MHHASRWLRWAISALPFALPLYLVRFRIGPVPTTLLEVFLLALFVLFTWSRGWRGWHEGWRQLGAWRGPILAWFLATLIAVFVAPDRLAALGLWRAYVLEPLLIFVVLAASVGAEEATRLRRNLFWVVILLALWAVVEFLTGKGIPAPWDVPIPEGRRATGPYGFPNALGLFVAPVGAFAIARWIGGRSDVRCQRAEVWLEGITGVAAIVTALVARSDGALVALLVVFWLAAILRSNWRRVTIVGTVVVAFLIALVPSIREPIVRELTFQSWSGQVRLFIWRETRDMLADHWFFGAGFGGYPTVFQPYHKATAIEIFQYPHNVLLNVWSEAGLLGVLAFGWIVVTWIRVSSIEYRVSSGGIPRQPLIAHRSSLIIGSAPLLAIVIHGLVDVPYFKNDLAVQFWMLAFLATLDPKRHER
jgi:hypothetical protein